MERNLCRCAVLGLWDLERKFGFVISEATQSILCKKRSPSNKKSKKSLYIRLRCRGDWPNIQPPGEVKLKATKTPFKLHSFPVNEEEQYLQQDLQKDEMNQAKVLFAQDPNYKKGFVFEHVWNILKNVQKFSEVNQIPKSQQKANAFSPPLTPSTASGVPSLDLNEDVDIKFTERPIGVKKAKANLQNEKNMHNMLESNKQMCEALKIGNEIALKKLEAQNEKKNRLVNETNRLTNITEENKILKRKAESQEEESRYQESQYRASQYQQDLENQSSPFQRSEEQDISEVQDQDQRPQEYSQYFHYLSGTVNDLNEC
ncbi:hypothetical protein LXL04_037792 [Taraxacum kok-saghyz]